jgi:hypothetical protein
VTVSPPTEANAAPPEPVRAELRGGPYDGQRMRVAGTDRPLLLPTDPAALTGEAPPTAPYFAQYGFDFVHAITGYAIFGFRGNGVDVDWTPPTPELEEGTTL